MKNKIKYYAPIGISFKTIFWFLVLQYGIVILQSLTFFPMFSEALYAQKEWSIEMGRVAEMESFVIISRYSFTYVRYACLGCLIALGMMNFTHHHKESKSVYLMKRIPNKYEFFRRVMTIPMVSSALLLVIAFLLLCIYYMVYIKKSPGGSVADGQLQLLIDVWFKGGIDL